MSNLEERQTIFMEGSQEVIGRINLDGDITMGMVGSYLKMGRVL